MTIRNTTIAATISLFLPALPALAGCLPNAEKSLSYCSGVLGMLAEVQSEEHPYFEDDYLELVGIVGDKQCGYYTPIDGLTELQWAELMQNAGKVEFGILDQAQDIPKALSLIRNCNSLYLKYYEN